jgi:hypothetical protein
VSKIFGRIIARSLAGNIVDNFFFISIYHVCCPLLKYQSNSSEKFKKNI